jgi:lipid A 3-O-deacylase
MFIVTSLAFAFAETIPCLASESPAQDSVVTPDAVTGLPKGTWELSVATGYTYTYRRTDSNVTKLKGVPAILGGGVVATDPIGTSWYRGQVTLGGEALFIQYVEPLTTYLVALTPTVKYTFLTSDRLRPFVEAGAGVVWTDLGDRIPEKGSQFNFNLQVGAGLSYFVAPTTSINLSYRFQHISNAGTADPNHGIDAGVVLIGVSKFF